MVCSRLIAGVTEKKALDTEVSDGDLTRATAAFFFYYYFNKETHERERERVKGI